MPDCPELLTARLRLRAREPNDLEALVAMDLDPRVHHYIYPEGAPSAEEIWQKHQSNFRDGWPDIGGQWIVEWQERPGLLGWCGLFPLEDSGYIELGYRFIHDAWGQGIATEAGQVLLEQGFNQLAFDPIVAVHHPENAASRRVLQKLGFRYEGLRHHYNLDLAFLRLTRSDYGAARVK